MIKSAVVPPDQALTLGNSSGGAAVDVSGGEGAFFACCSAFGDFLRSTGLARRCSALLGDLDSLVLDCCEAVDGAVGAADVVCDCSSTISDHFD